MDWIHQALDRVQRRALVDTVRGIPYFSSHPEGLKTVMKAL